MVKKITFHISPEGDVNLSVDGVKGSGCEAMSEPFETVLGKLNSRDLKDSYYEQAEETDGVKLGGTES